MIVNSYIKGRHLTDESSRLSLLTVLQFEVQTETIKMKVAIVVILCLALVAVGRVVKRQAGSAYNLPDGAELIVGSIKTGFSCAGRIYGYYADTDNNCQIFHVCVHHSDPENGIDETVQYSFFCGNQTVFDQANLVCSYIDDATPCSQAQSLYDEVNRNFGITDRPSG